MRNILVVISVLSLFACAQEEDESNRAIEEKTLKARIQVYYLDTLHKTESGMYYMVQAKGKGEAIEKENFVYVHYSTLDLFENHKWNTDSYTQTTQLMTSREDVAKQLGDYSPTKYYGPDLWITGDYSLTEGVEEMMITMREGDKRRIWLPSWLSSYGYVGSPPLYSSTTIHEVEILKVITDIEQFQIDSLESYRDKRYPGLDSLSYGFYIKTLKEGTGDTLKTGDKVNIWYVGRLLDDFVFDVNIADTAKRYNIFNSERSYEAFACECKEDGVLGQSGSEDSSDDGFVDGFSKAIFSMKHGEEAVAFFYSELGYGAQRKPFQSFTPLVFWLKVEKTNFDEEEKKGGEET